MDLFPLRHEGNSLKQLLGYNRAFTSLLSSFPRYFVLTNAIINETVSLIFFFGLFVFSKATPTAHGGSQARGLI